MPSITVTQTQVDGSDNADLNTELAKKRYDGSSYTTGLINGRFTVNNEVLTNGTIFKADNVEFAFAAPILTYRGAFTGGSSVTLDNANTGVQVGDIIIIGCYNYYGGGGGADVPALSGFTTITNGAFSTYFKYRWSYRIATSSDTSGSRYIGSGNNINTVAVISVQGTNTPVKQNHSTTHYSTQTTGAIGVNNSTNGVIIAYGISLGAYDLTTTEYSDNAGTRRPIADLGDLWNQHILSTAQPTIFAYRPVIAGETISSQSVYLKNTSFCTQMIVHFSRT